MFLQHGIMENKLPKICRQKSDLRFQEIWVKERIDYKGRGENLKKKKSSIGGNYMYCSQYYFILCASAIVAEWLTQR